jgi:hypothetical protein
MKEGWADYEDMSERHSTLFCENFVKGTRKKNGILDKFVKYNIYYIKILFSTTPLYYNSITYNN